MKRNDKHVVLGLMLMLMLPATFIGCGDDRAVQITQEANRRQAEQNVQMARVVDEETAFRQQMASLQNDLRADQASVAKERDRLEAERRQIASRREWAALWTPLLEMLGIVAVVIAVLTYSGFIVAHGFRSDSGADREVVELLMQEIASGMPARLPPLPAPGDVPRLPAPTRAEAAKAAGK